MACVLPRALLLALACALLAPAAAQACSLAPFPAERRVASADAAVFARVLTREQVSRPPPAGVASLPDVTYRYRLRVLRRYKGRVGRTVEVVGSSNEAMCGIGVLEVGRRVGLVLHGRAAPFRVDLASLISCAELERVRRAAPARRRG